MPTTTVPRVVDRRSSDRRAARMAMGHGAIREEGRRLPREGAYELTKHG